MKKTENPGRRRFVKIAVGTFASIPVVATTVIHAGDKPRLAEDDPQAVPLGYKHKGESVDTGRYPNFAASQTCDNCALYQGEDAAEWGDCAIFPGKQVAAAGWCAAYAAKPA